MPNREQPPDELQLALRAYAVPEVASSSYEPAAWTRHHPDTLLVFDTETTLNAAQRLTFGCARLYRPRNVDLGVDMLAGLSPFECFAEFLFYGDSVSDADLDVIYGYLDRFQTADYFGQYWNQATQRFEQGVVTSRIAEDGVPISLRSRRDFVRHVFMPMVDRARTMTVGFNLPFDVSRLAIDWGPLRRARRRKDESGVLHGRRAPWDAFEGGFSLVLAQKAHSDDVDTHRPRIAIKTIDSRRHLMQLRGGHDDQTDESQSERTLKFRGHFLDLRTLAFALTNESYTLRAACKAFGTEHGKDEHKPTGLVTRDELTYGRHDVRATFELADKLLTEYSRHPISPDHPKSSRAHRPLPATWIYSPASIGKAYLDAMGIAPPMERFADFPADVIGKAMTAFYGGRAECRLRRVPVPVRYLDFTSMYPTVNGLMSMWEVLTSQRLEVEDVTGEVGTLVETITPDAVFDRSLWPRLRVLVEIEPSGEILPTRGAYEGEGVGWQIGVNPLYADRRLWFGLPDVLGSALLGEQPPKIIRALRLVPVGRAEGMRSVSLRGDIEIDPANEDFFAAAIERRNELLDREGVNKPLSDFLKVLANATSYGIFAEMIRHELPKGDRVPVLVRGLGEPHEMPISSPEEPGKYCFPPLAALITSAARLMLALLERCVVDAGGAYVMVDTDSMAIVSTRESEVVECPGGETALDDGRPALRTLSWAAVDEIRDRFNSLNPYHAGAVRDIVKLEDQNFERHPTETNQDAVDRERPLQLHAYAISAKRYCLFNGDKAGTIDIRKASEHGLGHLLNPDDPDEAQRAWIGHAWRSIVSDADSIQAEPIAFEQRPAVSRLTVSSMALQTPFATYNRSREPDRQVRPFNFLLSANVASLGHPPGADPARFHLISRYESKPGRWLRMRWIDRYSHPPRSYGVTTGMASGDAVRIKSISDVLSEYRTHPEAKSLGPDGETCDRDTIGLLQRRPIKANGFVYIGKEANELDEVEAGLEHDLGQVLNNYGPVDDPWITEVLPALRGIPTGWLAKRCGVTRKTIQRCKGGRTRPRPTLQGRLAGAIEDWRREQEQKVNAG